MSEIHIPQQILQENSEADLAENILKQLNAYLNDGTALQLSKDEIWENRDAIRAYITPFMYIGNNSTKNEEISALRPAQFTEKTKRDRKDWDRSERAIRLYFRLFRYED